MNDNFVSNEKLLEQLKWRYAVKRFDPDRKISDQDWETLEDSLILAPSSYGLQPWKFYVVTDEAVRKELTEHSWNQPQISECSHLVVIAAKKDADRGDIEKYLERVIEVRGTPEEELEVLKGMMLGSQKLLEEIGFINEWAARQCFISLGFLLGAAAMKGIDSCPMEGFQPTEYDKVLGIADDGYFSVVVCALGYRNKEEDWLSKLPKVRYPKDDLIKRV
ncbi:MAG: NAD(P)H-dependent oxidoreductase [Pyrinomonadaceae bacterium]|nr:NAD(P)H-dependent oxidoreductase [Pyrinomonadaceae bacterium]